MNVTPRECWQAYVDDRRPEDFLDNADEWELRNRVTDYVLQMPHVYGIVLQKSWRQTFSCAEQLTREEVIVGLLEYLEQLRAERDAPKPEEEKRLGPPEFSPVNDEVDD